MVTIEEVAKRIKNGAEKYGWSNNDYDWKPKTLTHYDVPEFCIKESNVAGAKKKREDKDVSENIGAIKEVNPKDVKFSSVLKLEKPDKYSEACFENYLLQCLYDNYPGFKFYQQLADDINRLYYSEYPELKVKFKPTFTWDAKKTYVKGIGIRATNSLCNIRKEERIELKREYGFTLEKDVKSSVPRISFLFFVKICGQKRQSQ